MTKTSEQNFYDLGVKAGIEALERHNEDPKFNPSTVKMRYNGERRKMFSSGFKSVVGK